MSSVVVSTPAAESRLFVFEDEAESHVGTAAIGRPVEQSSTMTYTAHPQPGVARHDNRGGLSPHDRLTINNQKFPPSSIIPASQLAIRPAPEMAPSGIPALDALSGGLPRGCLTEICGPASSGRTTILLAALAAATGRGEYCAVIDASDALDPHSIAAAGVDLDRMLWVRCGDESSQKNHSQRHPSTSLRAGSVTEKTNEKRIGKGPALAAEGRRFQLQESLFNHIDTDRSSKVRTAISDDNLRNRNHSERRLEQILRATDLLLESGGFGLIILDLVDIPPQSARRIPLTTWFRFRRAVEHKPTILLAIEQQPIAGSCSSLLLQLGVPSTQYSGPSSNLSHTQLLAELQIRAELVRSRLDRKPASSFAFESKTAWTG